MMRQELSPDIDFRGSCYQFRGLRATLEGIKEIQITQNSSQHAL